VSFVNVHHGREVELGIDDLVSLWGGFQAREHQRLADGDVLMHDHGARVGAYDARDFVADRDGHVPPAFRPCAHAPGCPDVGVFVEPFVSRFGHCSETVRDQVNRSFENGKFTAPL